MITPEQQALNARFLAAFSYLEDVGQICKGSHSATILSRTAAAAVCFGVSVHYSCIYLKGARENTRSVPFDGAIRFCKTFGLNKYWMIFGEGEMLPETNKQP